MKVRDLMKQLEKYDPDAEIITEDGDFVGTNNFGDSVFLFFVYKGTTLLAKKKK